MNSMQAVASNSLNLENVVKKHPYLQRCTDVSFIDKTDVTPLNTNLYSRC